MCKFLLLLCFSVAASYAYGQTDSLTKDERRMLDPMFNNDKFIKLMMTKDESYVDVHVGIGHGIFNLKNNALNAGQAQTSKTYYQPAVGYYNKSGLAITASGFLATDNGKLKCINTPSARLTCTVIKNLMPAYPIPGLYRD